MALHCHDDFEAKTLNDNASHSSLGYILELRTVLIQGAPLFELIHPRHQMFTHPIFASPLYSKWAAIQRKHVETYKLLTGRESSVFSNATYETIEDQGSLRVRVNERHTNQRIHRVHADYLTKEASDTRDSLQVIFTSSFTYQRFSFSQISIPETSTPIKTSTKNHWKCELCS